MCIQSKSSHLNDMHTGTLKEAPISYLKHQGLYSSPLYPKLPLNLFLFLCLFLNQFIKCNNLVSQKKCDKNGDDSFPQRLWNSTQKTIRPPGGGQCTSNFASSKEEWFVSLTYTTNQKTTKQNRKVKYMLLTFYHFHLLIRSGAWLQAEHIYTIKRIWLDVYHILNSLYCRSINYNN